jgi:ATP/maltotriose-dependent transcriptional regulator MalT
MAGDRGGPLAYLVYRDGEARQRTFALDAGPERVRIGRGAAAELRLRWDRQVSRVHAELERLGDGWALVDDGLSANGTELNGERLLGRRRLAAGDQIRIGTTGLTFRTIADDESQTYVPNLDAAPVELTRLQQRVLAALCAPYRSEGAPATNRQIADELQVSVAAVKTHLRALFEKLAIADLPQNQKRARLAVLALERGLVSERDLAD